MKHFLLMVMAGSIVSAVPALAADITVTGELVDHRCYMRTGSEVGAGASHGACAQACARTGAPVALVTDESGDVYILAGQVTADTNAALVPHMSHTVEITGEVTEADGIKTITADTIKPVSAN